MLDLFSFFKIFRNAGFGYVDVTNGSSLVLNFSEGYGGRGTSVEVEFPSENEISFDFFLRCENGEIRKEKKLFSFDTDSDVAGSVFSSWFSCVMQDVQKVLAKNGLFKKNEKVTVLGRFLGDKKSAGVIENVHAEQLSLRYSIVYEDGNKASDKEVDFVRIRKTGMV